jgi:hypothetical protein
MKIKPHSKGLFTSVPFTQHTMPHILAKITMCSKKVNFYKNQCEETGKLQNQTQCGRVVRISDYEFKRTVISILNILRMLMIKWAMCKNR